MVTTSLGVSTPTVSAGYLYSGLGSYVPLTPFRILDTRSGLCGAHTCHSLGPGQTLTLQVTGYTDARTGASVPADATAVVLNVLAVNGSSSSLLTVYPNGVGRPLASNLNFRAHVNTANLVTVALGQNGASDNQREVEHLQRPGDAQHRRGRGGILRATVGQQPGRGVPRHRATASLRHTGRTTGQRLQ